MSEVINHNLLDIDSLSWAHYEEAAGYPYPVSYWGHIPNIDSAGHQRPLPVGSGRLLPFSPSPL